jgi:hypothetical protein
MLCIHRISRAFPLLLLLWWKVDAFLPVPLFSRKIVFASSTNGSISKKASTMPRYSSLNDESSEGTTVTPNKDYTIPYASISSVPKKVNVPVQEVADANEEDEEANVDEEITVSPALQSLYDTVEQLQQLDESIRIVSDDDLDVIEDGVPTINSIVFSFESESEEQNNPSYVLAVLLSSDQVDEIQLQQVVATKLECGVSRVQLTESTELESVCGFQAGSVPPIP